MSDSQLTERQLAVADGLARRLTIKQIAHELQVSDSAVNKHIAALKTKLDAHSIADVVAAYRAIDPVQLAQINTSVGQVVAREEGYREPSCSFSHLPHPLGGAAEALPDDPGRLHFSEPPAGLGSGGWGSWPEPRVVPRWLDGERPVLRRLVVVMMLVVLLLASIVVATTALDTISKLVHENPRNLAMQT